MTIATDHRLNTLFAMAPTRELAEALRMLADQPVTSETAQAHAWLIDELERRYPSASDAVGDAFLAAELHAKETGVAEELDYVEVLIGAIPAKAMR